MGEQISVVLFFIFAVFASFGACSLVAAVFAKEQLVRGLYTQAAVSLAGAVIAFALFFVV